MSLYPSLEDMKVDKILQEQQPPQTAHHHPNAPITPVYPGTNPSAVHYGTTSPSAPVGSALYPTVADYMGLDLSPTEMQIIHRQQQQLQSMAVAQSQKVRLSLGFFLGLSLAFSLAFSLRLFLTRALGFS